MTRSENYVREFALILFAQKHVIFWTTVAVFVGAILVAAYWPPMYSATGSVLLRGKQMDVMAPEAMEKKPSPQAFEASKEDVASEMEILLSPDVIKNALRALSGTQQDPSPERVAAVQRHLTATPVPASTVISVVYLDRDPGEAVRILDAILAQYLSHRLQFYKPIASQLTPPFLEERAAREREALEEMERQLVDLVDRTGVSAPQLEIDNNIVLQKRLEQELNVLNGHYLEQQAALEHMQRALANKDLQYFAFLESLTISKLADKLTDLTAERGRKARIYLPESEVLAVVDEQIRDTSASLKAEVQLIMEGQGKQLEATAGKIALIRESLAEYNAKNVEMQKQIIETGQIRREAGLLQHSYETLSQRKGEVEINEQLALQDTATIMVSVMSKAFPSNGPVYPSPLTIPIGLVVGLLTGLGFGYAREYFDHTFKKPSDVAAQIDLPVLFSLAGSQSAPWKTYAYLSVLVLLALGSIIYTLVQYGMFE